MKQILLFCLALICLSSCKNDDDNQSIVLTDDVVGSWNLIEFYADPGDGSGDFTPIESDKRIAFTANGNMSSNANLCVLFSEVGEPSTGTYSEEDNSLTIQDCNSASTTAFYEIVEGQLIVSYACIEGCQEKYEKEE